VGQESVIDVERIRKYPIIKAKRITTKFGPALVLSIRDSQDGPAHVFLPKRYSVMKDDDTEKIITSAVSLNLVYSCAFPATKAYQLAIEL